MKVSKLMTHLLRKSHTVVPTQATFGACAVALATLVGVSAVRAAPAGGDKLVIGETAEIAGGTAAAWARVNGGGKVIWVGLTFPLSMVENMPPRGTGPALAVAALNFPPIVQATTYFNHVQIQSQQAGHASGGADPHRYEAPHFDFHFLGISVEDLSAIPGGPFFANAPANRVPGGYTQPEPFSIPQMGRHAVTFDELAATDLWRFTRVAGFLPDASYMHFIEPMITQEFLLRRENFTLAVPRPAVLGRATNYPTECVAHFDKEADACHIVFRGFEPIE